MADLDVTSTAASHIIILPTIIPYLLSLSGGYGASDEHNYDSLEHTKEGDGKAARCESSLFPIGHSIILNASSCGGLDRDGHKCARGGH